MTSRRKTTLPVTGEVLRWAREYAGITFNAAAQALKMERLDLAALEAEERQPTLGELNALATAYGVSVSVLLLPSPPGPLELPTDYRTVGGVTAAPTPETVRAIREAQQLQAFISELAQDNPEIVPMASLPQITTAEDAEQVATAERQRFDVPLEAQLHWRMREVFGKWRSRTQTAGLLVLIKRMPREDCRGFSLRGEGLVPAIVVNSNDVEQAKAFTLFHEYGHLLLSDEGLCLRAEDNSDRGRVEKWCNEFAAAFLVPELDLRQYVSGKFSVTNATYSWTTNEIRRIANRYKVSRPAVALRLQKLELAPPNFYDLNRTLLNWSEQRPERSQDRPIKGITHPPGWREKQKLEEIGVSAAEAILEAWKSQVTDATDAADALGLSLDELFGLEDRVLVERTRNIGL